MCVLITKSNSKTVESHMSHVSHNYVSVLISRSNSNTVEGPEGKIYICIYICKSTYVSTYGTGYTCICT
jgi:hypothetical protein